MERLPVELLDRIIDYCDFSHNELLSARLVCRGFANSSLTARAFRRIRLCEFTRDAFDRLVHLSQSPVARYVVEFEYNVVPFVSLKNLHEVDPLIQLHTPDGTPGDVENLTRSLVAHHKTFLEQNDVLGTFFDIISLSRALPSFHALRSVTVARFVPEDAQLLPWLGIDDYPYEIGRKPNPYKMPTVRAFWGVVKAIQHCECPVASFSLDSVYEETMPREMMYGEELAPQHHSYGQREQLRYVFANLTSLSFSKLPPNPSQSWERTFQRIVFQGAPKLTALRVGTARAVREHHMPFWPLWKKKELEYLQFKNLAVLELRSRSFELLFQDILVEMLRRYKHTLKELVIWGLAMERNDSNYAPLDPHESPWNLAFSALRGELKLDSVQLDRLAEQEDFLEERYHRIGPQQLREWEGWLGTPAKVRIS